MSIATQMNEVGPSEAAALVDCCVSASRPVFLWGPPGIGKSDIVRQVAKSQSRKVIDVRAVMLDSVDIKGLPHVKIDPSTNQHISAWAIPDFLPRLDEPGILFLDELPQAPPLVQSACLQLVLDRRVGDYVLPPQWQIVAAGNRQGDRAGAHAVITPLLNRFLHVDLCPNLEDWLAWATLPSSNIHDSVVSYLRFSPIQDKAAGRTSDESRYGAISEFSKDARAFPSPRSWHCVSDLAHCNYPDKQMHKLVVGAVGDSRGSEYMAIRRIINGLPDIDVCLQNPLAAKGLIPQDPAMLYAFVGAVAGRARTKDMQKLENISLFMSMFPRDFQFKFIKDVSRLSGGLIVRTPTFGKVMNHPDMKKLFVDSSFHLDDAEPSIQEEFKAMIS